MKILLLAPQPFFQERGTPIAVRLAAEVLAGRDNDTVHLLTYHEGENIPLQNVVQFRTWMPFPMKDIGPGISLKKIVCDLFFFLSVIRLLFQARKQQYDLIHAVEESVFIALFVRLFTGIPYIYDMDSSLALQVTEKWRVLKPLRPVFLLLERIAVRGSMAVVPVCDALAAIANRHGSKDTHILRDISLLNTDEENPESSKLREEFNLAAGDVIFLYIGNLERYQGIDLLLESFQMAFREHKNAKLVIIGGSMEHLDKYKDKVRKLQLEEHVFFTGPRPVAHLHDYLIQADVLVSPRIDGNNTPMKIYSYLHSGVVVLATNLPTHTQVLNNSVACLAEPVPEAFSQAISELTRDAAKRVETGSQGRALAEREYTFEVFERRLNELYDRVEKRVQPATA